MLRNFLGGGAEVRKESAWKGTLTGFAGGIVGWWAVDRFYRMARASSRGHALLPFCIGAGIGAAYGGLVLSRNHLSPVARVPLGAAVYLAHPEGTAVPRGGTNTAEKVGSFVLRLASKGLKSAAERALFA